MFLFVLALFTWEWVETTQQDFKDGRYEANLYSSHRGDGAVEFTPRWDANNDGWIDLLSCHVYGGSKIFWGGPNGFSDSRCSGEFFPGTGGSAFADLNQDCYTDYITTGPVCIYWGSTKGPDTSNLTALNYGEEACFIADFNKDGYLDIAFDFANEDYGGVYWGSANGYSDTNVTLLPTIQAQHNIEAADLNKDNWLDLVLINQMGSANYIYWGSEVGFTPSNRKTLPYLQEYPHGCSIGDVDSDGWLDLIFTGNYNIDEAWIYWGPNFAGEEKTVLNTEECYGGSAIAELNGDGILDIVFFPGAQTSYLPRIQWGDNARFHTDSFSLIEPEVRLSGGLISDFDRDGYLDIFANSYDEASPIFYGPDFDSSNITYLHGGIDHHAITREIGNVYTRKYTEEYYSSVFDAQMDIGYVELSWEDSCPGQSRIRFAIRTGEKPDTTHNWSAWFTSGNGEHLDISKALLSKHRYIQYKAIFEYSNPAQLPILKEVKINYEEVEGLEEIVQPSTRTMTVNPYDNGWLISFFLSESQSVLLDIYDASGRKIYRRIFDNLSQGEHSIAWGGCDKSGITLPQGVYFVRLSLGDETQTTRVVLKR